MKTFRVFLFLLTFAGLFSSAQAAGDDDMRVQARFRVLSLDFTRTDIYVSSKERPSLLHIEEEVFSPQVVSYDGPIVMPLLRKTGNTFVPAGEVRFPNPGPGNYLLFLVRTGRDRVSGMAIPAPPADQQPGHLRVINLMSRQTALLVNAERKTLDPRAISEHAPTPDTQKFIVRIGVQHRGRWIEATNTFYRIDLNTHRTVFVIDRTARNAPEHQLPAIGFFSVTEPITPPQADGLRVTAR